jgi:hypothetical protein
VFIYTVIDKSFPWLRHGKPIGTSYDDFERWHQRNIAAKRDLEKQRQDAKPRAKENRAVRRRARRPAVSGRLRPQRQPSVGACSPSAHNKRVPR